jgi:hypothetical protein
MKSFRRKLALRKETLRSLDAGALPFARGAGPGTAISCFRSCGCRSIALSCEVPQPPQPPQPATSAFCPSIAC